MEIVPPKIETWHQQPLPGTTSSSTIVIVGVAAVAAVVVVVVVSHHKKHPTSALNNKLNPDSNFNYYTSEPKTELNPNFDINLVLNGNIKGVGIRYAF